MPSVGRGNNEENLLGPNSLAWRSVRHDGGVELDKKLGKLSERFTFKEGSGEKLGTIKGVFIPTLQNILGIILFVRLPWITGQAGISGGIAIVLLGCSASFLTALSISAISTNGIPKGGGAFSVIKESIGPEFGGTVGTLLFLSNCFGIAMYVLACVEIFQIWPLTEPALGGMSIRVLGAIILFSLFAVVFVGISYISKFSMLFMAGVMLAVLSIDAGVVKHAIVPDETAGIVGFSASQVGENWGAGYSEAYNFAAMLAIFFPAVTDPLAGSNLSGDLKDPQGSIPPGTVGAVIVTTFIFLGQVLFTGGSCTRDTLIADGGGELVTSLAWPFQEVVWVGMLMSTLGAGLQSLAGAPRLLAAIGREGLIPEFRAFAPKEGNEPRLAVACCAALSLCAVMLGDLNAVAPFITMWFLTCYGIINGACAYLAYERILSFRPTFKYFDWRLSLVGAVQCFGMMFFCAPTWYHAVLACCVAVFVYKYVQRTVGLQAARGPNAPPACLSGLCYPGSSSGNDDDDEEGGAASGAGDGANNSGGQGGTDWRAGRRFTSARESLLSLQPEDMEFKYWRPFVLFLAKTSMEDGQYVPQDGMIHLVHQLMKRGQGLSLFAGVIEGTFEEKSELCETALGQLRSAMSVRGIEGFPEMICAPSTYAGYKTLVTAKGLGALRPNTVMLGWHAAGSTDAAQEEEYCSLLSYVALAKKTLLICKGGAGFPASNPGAVGSAVNGASAGVDERMKGFIDVWWLFDLFPSNGLMLLLPYLLQKHRAWSQCATRLFVVATPTTDLAKLKRLIQTLIAAGGIVVQVECFHMDPEEAPRFQSSTEARAAPSGHALTGLPLNAPLLAPTISGVSGGGVSGGGVSGGDGVELSKASDASTVKAKRKGPAPSALAGLLATHSSDSALCVVTLPKKRHDQGAGAWLRATEELVAALQRVIFVQESGHERIQFMRD